MRVARKRWRPLTAGCAVLAFGAAAPLLAHGTGIDDCTPAHVRLSVSTPGIAFTGGSYAVAVNLRNVGRSECSVEGHPLVVVSPHPFPIVVGDVADFDRNDPLLGPERVLHVQPGRSVHAQVVIRRLCDGSRSEMTRTRIAFSSYSRNAYLEIPACRRTGAEIDTGPYLAGR